MKSATILLVILIFIIGWAVYLSFESPDNPTIPLILSSVSAAFLLTNLLLLNRQLEYAEKTIETTSRPNICVGITSFKGNGLKPGLGEKYSNTFDKALLDTRIVIKNFSNIQSFVWTKLNLEIDNKEANNHITMQDYCFAKATWELDPNEFLAVPLLKESIIDYKNQTINISMSIYFSHIRKLPKNPDWIELTAYSFRKNGQWLKNNLGIPFHLREIEGLT